MYFETPPENPIYQLPASCFYGDKTKSLQQYKYLCETVAT